MADIHEQGEAGVHPVYDVALDVTHRSSRSTSSR